MDTATSVKVNICILFATHCNSVIFRIMSQIQGGNRAGATIGRIVLPRYLGQILRARGVAGFRWDWEGGRFSPSYFRTLPPLDSPPYIIALSHEECWVTSFALSVTAAAAYQAAYQAALRWKMR